MNITESSHLQRVIHYLDGGSRRDFAAESLRILSERAAKTLGAGPTVATTDEAERLLPDRVGLAELAVAVDNQVQILGEAETGEAELLAYETLVELVAELRAYAGLAVSA